jgi:eukaryotic-like serine/threonine-protein kinase
MTPERWQRLKAALAEAMEYQGDARRAYLERLAARDPGLRCELDALLVHGEALGEEFLSSPAAERLGVQPPPRLLGRQLGPYRLVELIGCGGMGEVYRAERSDAEYQKEVAIKLVRSGQDIAFLAERLRAERQILATFEHPNIARLLDGGSTEEGIPYIVMELVAGRPITVWCEEQRLDVDARLRLFLQVCAAVQYAHARMVIHRDLKPSNILVTPEGLPKLLDFGIAKILHEHAMPPQAETTIAALRALTPRYASPEQVRGEPVTAASDVYSLGVVLHELLTGATPAADGEAGTEGAAVGGSMREPKRPSAVARELAQRAAGAGSDVHAAAHTAPDRHSEPAAEPPRRLEARLRGDLDRIVLMALRREPDRRYGTVEQFADDIRRHLEHLPVRARPPTLAYRLSSFVARHTAGVAAAALVAVALLGGIVMTLREARVADVQRNRAERRFQDVRDLAHALMYDIHDAIVELPNSLKARKLLTERALTYLDSLSREAGGDRSLLRELAAAYKRIGDVQGYQWRANLGDTAGALTSYQKSLAILAGPNLKPATAAEAATLAEAQRLVGELMLVNNNANVALQHLRSAAEVGEQALRLHPEDAGLLSELARDYDSWADTLSGYFNTTSLADNAGAMPLRRKALEITQRLARLQPTDAAIARRVGVESTRLGDQLMLAGQWHAARDQYRTVQGMFEKSASEHPDDAYGLEVLEQLYTRIDGVDKMAGDAAAAVAIDRAALQISQGLTARDPADSHARLSLAGDYGNLADTLADMGQPREAREALLQGLQIGHELVKATPGNAEFAGVLAALDITAGDVERRFDNFREALRYYREAERLVRAQAADPANIDARLRLAVVINSEAAMLTQLRDATPAAALYTQALELARPSAAAQPANEQALYSTADSYSGWAESELVMAATAAIPGEHSERLAHACSLYRQSLATWARIKEPGLLSPDLLRTATPPERVAQELARCERSLPPPRPAS